MANFGSNKTQIASEIERTDLDTLIGEAIVQAIRSYETEEFTFNQVIDTSITTVAGTGVYNLPTGFTKMVSIKILV